MYREMDEARQLYSYDMRSRGRAVGSDYVPSGGRYVREYIPDSASRCRSRGSAGRSACTERVLTPSQKRMRRERIRRRKRKQRIRAAVMLALYLLMGAAIAGGLFFLGKGISGLGGFFGSTESANASLTGGAEAKENPEALAAAAGKQGPVICLDPGHGGNDQGTSYQELLEKDINLAVAEKVEKYLENAGCQVVMTRKEDIRVDKYYRAELANQAEADVFVSIHCNYLEQGEASGIEIYFDPEKTEGGILGRKIMNQMTTQTGASDRDVRTEDFVVTRETNMPSVLVELGYLSDGTERGKLMTDSYQNLLAKGIAQGILDYVNE